MTDPDRPQSAADIAAFGSAAADAARDARRASEAVQGLTAALGRGLGRAVSALTVDGARASDVFRRLALSLSRSALNAALRPVERGLGAALGQGISTGVSGLVSAAAGAVAGARPFAKGGVVGGPTLFASRAGLGLMGEAGPEAILPLARGADGRLGVAAQNAPRQPAIQVTIQARDADSFRRSRTQVAAQLARALDRGRRTL